MAWEPLPPDPPAGGWWTGLETELDRWIAGVAADVRAERVERCRQIADEVETRCAEALSSVQRDQMLRFELFRRGGGQVVRVY